MNRPLPVHVTSILLLLFLWPAGALGSVFLLTPNGPIIPGAENQILVVLHRDGKLVTEALPALAAEPGEVLSGLGRVRDGIYDYRYLAPANLVNNVAFTVGTGAGGLTRITLPVGRFPGPSLHGPDRVSAMAGRDHTVDVPISGEQPLREDHVQIALSEGEVESVHSTPTGLVVRVALGGERYPRVALIGVWDERRIGAPPVWVPIHISARPRIPVRTEPRAKVSLNVNGRSYGPFVADDAGVALAVVDVYPGEETAAVRIEDELGNIQNTTLNLIREPRPLLLAFAEPAGSPGSTPVPIHMAALDNAGRPWVGERPVCQTSQGGRIDVVKTGRGLYRASPNPSPTEDFLDLKIDCRLPGTLVKSRLRIPMGEGMPQSLVLRLYPEVLSADFPVAQVQAFLEDRRGERLPTEGIRLGADAGVISIEGAESRSLRGEYNGARGGAGGYDRIWARYNLPAGDGFPARLQVAHGAMNTDRSSLLVYGRTLDQRGRPLAGVTVTLSAGSGSANAVTNERGWASAEVPLDVAAEVVLLEARLDNLVNRAPFLPRDPDPAVAIDEADLEEIIDVPITAGRVREVLITSEPSILEASPSARARVSVRLVDRNGNAVTDGSVELKVDAGEVSSLRTRADGTYEAWYRPPPGLKAGSIRMTATGQEGAFAASTVLTIVPRPLSLAMGISVGAITNFGSIRSPVGEIHLERRLSRVWQRLLLRVSAAHFWDSDVIQDELTNQEVVVRSAIIPVSIAAVVRQERGLRASWVGAGLVALPFQVETVFGDSVAVRGYGVGGPGFQLFGGIGWRLGLGEVSAELRYVQASTATGALEYTGTLGGLAPLLQYRILF